MSIEEFLSDWHSDSPTLLVHTSGSTGQPKPLYVDKQRMEASARITCGFLGLKKDDTALLCLPLDYIAGKMMVVRALTCGLRLIVTEPTGTPSWKGHIDFAAMVPMQVYNLLQTNEGRERLMQIRHLIIGGSAIDSHLAENLKSFPNAVWSTYGMTETLSHIALRRLSGMDATEWYTPFEGVSLSLSADGCLIIDAPAVHDGLLMTNDIAEIRPNGTFRVLGRRDNTICSGGIKIQMETVEELLHPHLKVPFCITKCKDEKLGEAVVLLIEAESTQEAETISKKVLPRYWQPRYYLCVDHIPQTPTSKIDRQQTAQIAAAQLVRNR